MKKIVTDIVGVFLILIILLNFDGVVSWIVALSILPIKWFIERECQEYKRDDGVSLSVRPDMMIVNVSMSKIAYGNIGMFMLDKVSFVSKETGLILAIMDINIPIYSTAFISSNKWMTGNRGVTINYVDLINRVLFNKPYDSGSRHRIKYSGTVDTVIDIDSRLRKNEDAIIDALKDLLPIGDITINYSDKE